MIIFDAHLDLAWNALDWNRNLQLPCATIRQIEKDAGYTDKGRCCNTVSFPDLRRGKVVTFVATVLARLESVFADAGRGFYLIAEVDGERAGQMMITYEWSDWRNGVFWWIQSVYTVPELRGRGAFKAMYAAVEELARERGGVCGLLLYVEAHNETAQATFRRCGMSETVYRRFEAAR